MKAKLTRLWSFLLALVMVVGLLPTMSLTAYAEEVYPDADQVSINGKAFYITRLYYTNAAESAGSLADNPNWNAHYDPTTGILELNNFDDGYIRVGGTVKKDITIKLTGTNKITTTSQHGIWNSNGGDITITADSKATLEINVENSETATGISADTGSSHTTGSVTLQGYADVIVKANTTGEYKYAYGIKGCVNASVIENASFKAICSGTNNGYGYGIYAAGGVTINTNGTIDIDVTGCAGPTSIGCIGGTNAHTLTKVGKGILKYPSDGGAIAPASSKFSESTHAINKDPINCVESYRYGTPYTVTVESGMADVYGLMNKKSAQFVKGDTVTVTANTISDLTFKKWTSAEVTVADATNETTTFTMPAKPVTVTANYNLFTTEPSFARTSDTQGTISFTLVATPSSAPKLVEKNSDTVVGDQYFYGSALERSNTVRDGNGPYNVPAGEYRIAVKYGDTWLYSDVFTVNYTAAPAPTATVGDVTIDGVKDSLITNKDVVITLANDKFNAIVADTDVKGWFTNLPAGLDAKIKTAVNANDTTATIEISGTPSVASSAELAIKIPAANLVSNADLTVTSNANAKYNITAPATPITDTDVPVSNLTGKTYNESAQEPTFGGSLIRDTDYTVSYAVKSGSTGALDGGKPKDAGTYVVTVAGKGSYTGSFTKDFEIGKATPVYTAPTAKTGLAYTGSAQALIHFGFVNKGGEMQYKLDSGSYGTGIPAATDAGNYTVYFKIVENDNYNAVPETQVGTGAINIAPADQNAPTGLGVAAPTASGGNGKITGTTTAMEYSTDSGFTSPAGATCTDTATEVAPGTYYVRYKADANHNAGAVSAALVVPAYSATKYTVTVTSDANGTASADKIADVAAGETVTLTATPNSGYVFDNWVEKNPTSLTIGADGKFNMPGDNVSVKATFKPAALTGTVNITGTLKYGQELTADATGITNNTGTLTYKWYRSGETAEIATNTTGKYTLVEDDIGKTITVKVSSDVQTGEISSSATGNIDRADGLRLPA